MDSIDFANNTVVSITDDGKVLGPLNKEKVRFEDKVTFNLFMRTDGLDKDF